MIAAIRRRKRWIPEGDLRNMVEKMWEPPYSRKDRLEVEEKWERKKAAQRYSLRSRPRPVGRPRKYRLIYKSEMSNPLFRQVIRDQLPRRVRETYGLSEPVAIQDLAPAVEGLGRPYSYVPSDTYQTREVRVWYVVDDWFEFRRNGIHVFEVDYLYLPNLPVVGWMGRVGDAISEVSEALNCHDALSVAYLLSDWPPEENNVTIVMPPFYSQPEGISVYVAKPDVPVKAVSLMYTLVRKLLLSTKRRKDVTVPRPRGRSKKVLELIDFAKQQPSLTWKARLEKWNQAHPEWKYDSITSMQAVYYRARGRQRPRNKKGEQRWLLS